MYLWSERSEKAGPHRRIERKCGDWNIVAEELPFPDGMARWAVRAEHKDGFRKEGQWTVGRVPMGPNLHDNPDNEIERLIRVIDWP
jgi:hypothetical protein